MKIRKLVITATITLAVIIAGISGWVIWNNSNTPALQDNGHLDWVWVSALPWEGALSEQGYYYGSNVLSYCDFATEKHAVLCAKPGCKHEYDECDAYINTLFGRNMFYGDGYVYYVRHEYDGQHLDRRDATGSGLVSIGMPGEHYIKQGNSVEIDHLTLVDGYLYYQGEVGRDIGTTVTLDQEFIARMNLTTGKEEILVEVTMENAGAHLRLCAVRKSGVIYSRYIIPDTDRDDPGRTDIVMQTPHTLYMWSEDTGETTKLLEKPLEDFSVVGTIYGGKVFYRGMTQVSVPPDLYAYDLATGKTEQWITGRATHLGGGYALLQREDMKNYDLINLFTKEKLPNVLNEIADGGVGNIRCASDSGLILMWWGKEHRKENEGDEYGYRDQHYSYITYASLADGLQQEDLIPVFTDEIYVNDPDYAPPATSPSDPVPTTPTNPEDPRKAPVDFWSAPPVPDEEAAKIIQYLPKTVENPNNLPVLKWVCLVENKSVITFTEDAVVDLNRMLAEKNIPFRLQIVIATYKVDSNKDHLYSELDWFSSPEIQELLEDADLIYAPMSPEERKAHLLPITEYATGDAQPSLKESVLHELNWISTYCDGEIYGIPASFSTPNTTGWIVDTNIMEKTGLTIDDFKRGFWEMDNLFAKIYAANGNKPFLDLANTSASFAKVDQPNSSLHRALPKTYQEIGALFAIDYTADKPTVVNLLELDVLDKIRQATARYKAAGYIIDEFDENFSKLLLAYYGTIFGDVPLVNGNFLRIPTGASTVGNSYATKLYLTGIASGTENKEEILTLLNLIAEDAAFRNMLLFGKEGRDYNIIDGELSLIQEITPVEEVKVQTHPDGGTSTSIYRYDTFTRYDLSFLSGLSNYGTLTKEMQYGYPTYESKTKLESYLDAMTRITYIQYPIQFDFTGLETELELIGQLLGPYWYNLMDASSVTVEAFDQLLADLEAAGSSRILNELQRQLDEWLAENPEWK